MPELDGLGKMLLVAGGLLMLAGIVVLLLAKGHAESGPLSEWFGWVGKLPGDISIKREGVSFYFPLTTSIVISVVLSLLIYLFSKR
ncbi:MAG: DUF2905 domain-containing protein [Nitrospira sp.]|nr:DUF2905 domain-containing protein [Nitrospira sp.]